MMKKFTSFKQAITCFALTSLLVPSLSCAAESTKTGNEFFFGEITYSEDPSSPLVVIYSDITCHYCNALHKTVKRVIKETSIGVKYRFFPMSLENKRSVEFTKALYCGKKLLPNYEQKQLIGTLYQLVRLGGADTNAAIISSFTKLGFTNNEELNQCLVSNDIDGLLKRNLEMLSELSVGATPTLYFYNEAGLLSVVKQGAFSKAQFVEVIKSVKGKP